MKGANIELDRTWRTNKEELKSLWNAVRKKSVIVTEKLSMDGPFSENLGENIFQLDEEEVVLCLNYDGKFGLNNMNQYFQNANTNSEAFSWEEWNYKIGDKIIFTNTKRSALLYNNLKGTIKNISYGEKRIIFEIAFCRVQRTPMRFRADAVQSTTDALKQCIFSYSRGFITTV